jgi:integrase
MTAGVPTLEEPRNASEAVDPPKAQRKEIRPLTPEQVRTLLKTAQGDRLEALYALAITTGLRQGELFGLRWQDVDMGTGRLSVRQTLTTPKGGRRLGPPKRSKSRRSVKLTAGAVKALRAHRERQLERNEKSSPNSGTTMTSSLPHRWVRLSTGTTSSGAASSPC